MAAQDQNWPRRGHGRREGVDVSGLDLPAYANHYVSVSGLAPKRKQVSLDSEY